MSTLAEIESAASTLPSEQKEELLLFLAMRLREERLLPPARQFSQEQIHGWIAEDEADMARFRLGE